jgi:hypothetical protein
MVIPTNPPGHWQHFILRNDNRGLTTEQIRQKYLKEQLLFENYISFIQQQQLLMSNAASGGGAPQTSTSSTPSTTPITWEFVISSGNNTVADISVVTKADKSLTVTYEWDAMGSVEAGSLTETIGPSGTSTEIPDLGAADINVPFRIIFSDITAVENFYWYNDGELDYQITSNDSNNLDGLETPQLLKFENHSVNNISFANVVCTTLFWVSDPTISLMDLSNANVETWNLNNNTGLVDLTLTDLQYGNESSGYYFNFNNCAINEQSAVDLLRGADESGYENGTIDLVGTNNYPGVGVTPVGGYSTAKANLISKGWTVTDNND